MGCLLGAELANANDGNREIAGMLLDDREGYPLPLLTESLTSVLGQRFSEDTVEAHRSLDCGCEVAA